MVLASAPKFANGKGLDVHVRTKIRQAYSFIESAALRIADEILEVASFGDFLLNGIAHVDMPNVIAGYPITYTSNSDKDHEFVVHVSTSKRIVMKAFKGKVDTLPLLSVIIYFASQ